MLTPGQAHDLACAEPLIDNADPDALLADKAYDADSFIDTLTQRGITPVIPPKANRKTPRACDFALYCERNLVERFFNQLKHFRAIATRYDKLARNFLAGVQMAAAMILLTENRRAFAAAIKFGDPPQTIKCAGKFRTHGGQHLWKGLRPPPRRLSFQVCTLPLISHL